MTILTRPPRPKPMFSSSPRAVLTAGMIAILMATGGGAVATAQPSTTPDAPLTTAPQVLQQQAPVPADPCATTTAPSSTTTAPPTTTPTTTTAPATCTTVPSTPVVAPSATPAAPATTTATTAPAPAPAPAPASPELAPVPLPAEPAAVEPVAPADDELSSKTTEPDPDYTPTEDPNATIVPGEMRSDRDEIPAGATKEMADKAETMEARQRMSRAAVGCQVYWPFPYEVCGVIRDKYNSLGGPGSFLSYPNSPEFTNPDGIGKRTQFLNGPIYWSPASGAHPVVNSFLNRWGVHQYEAGWLKYPTTDEIVLPDGGRRQEFQQGAIYVAFQNAAGSAIANGPLRDKYNSVGGLTPGSSFLGYLTEDHKRSLPGTTQGQMARFQNGVIYYHPVSGAHWVNGRLLEIWSQSGYEAGEYGYPTSDTAPRVGEAGSAEQSFVSGTMYSAQDQMFRGLVVPAASSAEPTFKSYDTGEHPNYDIQPNLSEYGVLTDSDGAATRANRQTAAVTQTYFSSEGATNSRSLFDHYYGNSGLGFGADPGYLFGCLRSATQNYPAGPPDNVPPTPSGNVSFNNQAEAVQIALSEAQRTNKKIKVILAGPWNRRVAASGQDCVLGVGRFTMSSTTAVIASPGVPGSRPWSARQAGHMQDIYDYAPGSGEYPPLAQTAVNNAYEGMRLGTAKPFLVYGTSTDYYSQGMG